MKSLASFKRRRAVVPLGSLSKNPRNPRSHPEKQMEHYVAAVRQFGQMRPVLVREANSMIIAGHGLVEAMDRLGHQECEADFIDCDQHTADAFMATDNKMAQLAVDSADKVKALLGSLDDDWHFAMGYEDDELRKLFEEEEAVAVREIEATEVRDEFWLIVRGPLVAQARALQHFQTLSKDMPEIVVELGTVTKD